MHTTRGKASYFTKDGKQIDEEDAYDESGMIKDGVRMHVPLMMCDSNGHMLVDALGEPLPSNGGRVAGYVFRDTDNTVREENYQLSKAQLSAAWRGGLRLGDEVMIGDQRMRVSGNNRDNNRPILSDASTVDADAQQSAYEISKRQLADAWKTRPTSDSGTIRATTTKRALHASRLAVCRASGVAGRTVNSSVVPTKLCGIK